MTGDADEANKTFIAGPDCGFQRAARAERGFPFRLVNKIMKLNQIDLVGAQSFERAADLVVSRTCFALASFGGQEKAVSFLLHPRTEANFGVAIAGGGVDMVDPRLDDQFHRAVGVTLTGAGESRRPEDDAGAGVTCVAEGMGWEHVGTSSVVGRLRSNQLGRKFDCGVQVGGRESRIGLRHSARGTPVRSSPALGSTAMRVPRISACRRKPPGFW